MLLAGLAARTRRVRLGQACMASFTLRDPIQLAYQWASLDLLAGGRTVMVGCTGIVPQAGGELENRTYGVDNRARVERLVEWIKILKLLWTEDNVTFEGKHYRFEGVTIEPKPVQRPRPPIWIANNAQGDRAVIERTHLRVARHADGWQTSISEPEDVAWRIEDVRRKARDLGRNPDEIETHLYHNINVNEDQQAALAESQRFLEDYYMTDMSKRVTSWTAAGSPAECIEHLRAYERMGFSEVTLSITSWNQQVQLRRVLDEVLPQFA